MGWQTSRGFRSLGWFLISENKNQNTNAHIKLFNDGYTQHPHLHFDIVDIYPLPGTFLGQSFGESYELVSFGGDRKSKSLILFFRLSHFNICEAYFLRTA